MRVLIHFLKIVSITAIIFLVQFCETHAQKTFYRTIGHQIEGGEGRNVVQAGDGGYFLSYYFYFSSRFIACLSKLNCAGLVEWEYFYEDGSSAIPVDLIPQSDNGCLMALSVQKPNGQRQIAVMRVDGAGNTLWTQRLEGQAANTTGCMVQHPGGSIYVCGSDSVATTGTTGTVITKISADGSPVWQKQYGEMLSHSPRVITITSGNRIVIVGQVGIPNFIFTNIFIFTADTNGTFIKRKVVTTYYDDEPRAVCADKYGNIAITGYSYFLTTQWDMFFLKMDEQLNILQSKFYDSGSSQGEQARYMVCGNDNSFILFGDEGGFNERNPAAIKLTSQGNVVWAKKYAVSTSFTNYLFHGSTGNDGGLLMTGDVRPISQFRIAPFMKTDSNGELGCYTSQLNLIERTELFSETDTSLLEFSITPSPDTTAVPYSTLTIATSNTVFCQSLVPCGNFTFTLDSICPRSCFSFEQTSLIAGSWSWTFENGMPASFTGQHPPPVCFTGQGPHHVTLTLSNAVGSSSVTKLIDADINCPFFIPDIFTPNSDGTNNTFHVRGVDEPFSLSIFNRWGQEIFTSDVPGAWWDGYNKKGQEATEGVYFYILSLHDSNKVFKGTVHLVR